MLAWCSMGRGSYHATRSCGCDPIVSYSTKYFRVCWLDWVSSIRMKSDNIRVKTAALCIDDYNDRGDEEVAVVMMMIIVNELGRWL